MLLQVLDDGRITDSHGRTVDFKNTIIILTSNLGSDIILDGIGPDGGIAEHAREAVGRLLRQNFRPEFLNRLDEIVFYKPLRMRTSGTSWICCLRILRAGSPTGSSCCASRMRPRSI